MSDSLIKLGGNLLEPRNSKPSDYPAVGPMGAAGMAMGQDKLVPMNTNQWMPMHTEDDGPGTPVPTDRSRLIAMNFPVSKNGGESGMKPMDVSIKGSVDFSSGQMSPMGTDQRY